MQSRESKRIVFIFFIMLHFSYQYCIDFKTDKKKQFLCVVYASMRNALT